MEKGAIRALRANAQTWVLPYAWSLLNPAVTVPLTTGLLAEIAQQGDCPEMYYLTSHCRTPLVVASLTPGLLNLVPVAWVLSPNPFTRTVAMVLAWLGAARLFVPAAIHLSSGPFVPKDAYGFAELDTLLASVMLYAASAIAPLILRKRRPALSIVPLLATALLAAGITVVWVTTLGSGGELAIGGTPSAEDYYSLGTNKWLKDRYAAAEADLTRALELSPGWGDAHNIRALVRTAEGNHENALADANAAVIATRNHAVLDTRGYVYLKLSRPSEALQDYDAALAANPEYTESLLGRGLVWLALGNRDAAVRDLQAGEPRACRQRNSQMRDLLEQARRALPELDPAFRPSCI